MFLFKRIKLLNGGIFKSRRSKFNIIRTVFKRVNEHEQPIKFMIFNVITIIRKFGIHLRGRAISFYRNVRQKKKKNTTPLRTLKLYRIKDNICIAADIITIYSITPIYTA